MQQEKSNLIEKPIDTPEKTHGNSIQNEELRMELTKTEIILKFPEECKKSKIINPAQRNGLKVIIKHRDNPDPAILKIFMWTERTM